MDRLISPFRQSKLLNTLFLSNIFLTFHYALIIYVNSSLLDNSFSEAQISALYIIGSFINTILLLNASKILEKINLYRFTIYTLIVELLTTVGLLVSSSPFLIGLYFIVHHIAITFVYFNMDIFVEKASTDEKMTGSIRATYMTLANITFVISPALVSILVFNNNYTYVYLLSSLFLLPLFYLIKKFKNLEITNIKHIKIRETTAEYIKDKDLYNIFISNLLLQLFYAFMVIYMPLYLAKIIGFSWSEIGIIFTIMLLPFVMFEIPVGEMEDDKYGEKEFLTIGFIILGLATICMSFITVKSFWIWAAILFVSRIGASLVEVSVESYFFKKVNQEKGDIIGFFRMARPLSFIIAPILATLSLQFIPFQYVFIVIGAVVIIGCHYSLGLRDTK
ncbi:MAG: MFS transporter [Candidatus Zambryskibacteria bacterium]|nr:MFS transporter [Candidatus Zambryskibacteria bacterium]